MKRTDKLEKLEKKLNIANDMVDTMTATMEEEFGLSVTEISEVEVISSADVPVVEEDPRVFEIDNLKSDFQLIRQNILQLVSNGQRILKTAAVIDVADLSAKQIEALASLQQTIGNNLELMIKCYKSIADIEKLRQKEQKKIDAMPGAVNMGQVVNNNIVFNGDTSQLLDLIRSNQ